MSIRDTHQEWPAWRHRLHEIIFEADTPAGKAFDLLLLISIGMSILVVMLDSVASIRVRYGNVLTTIEWGFTFLFTIEYILRLISVRQPWRYATSFFGLVDLLAILPTYLSLFIPRSHYFVVIRALRLLRIFRVLKLANYLYEARVLGVALRASRQKITVFLLAVVSLVIIIGAIMYVVEGEANGFTSIPVSVYWAIVTLTTVGYGDVSPQTPLGQMLASIVMLLGYGILAVPTGIVTFELSRASSAPVSTQACEQCGTTVDIDANYCKQCGVKL